MFFRIIIFASLFLFIPSCSNLKTTQNEEKGVNEVIAIYGGICKYSKIWKRSTDEGKKKTFELEISGSELIDQTPTQTEMFAAGVAYTFYKHLEEEKSNYTHIRTVFVDTEGNKKANEFEVQQLNEVHAKMPISDTIAGLIISKKFARIGGLLHDSSYLLKSKSELLFNLKKAESNFNSAIAYIPLGFDISRVDGHNNLHVVGQIKRMTFNTSFSVDIDMDDTTNRVVYINYEY